MNIKYLLLAFVSIVLLTTSGASDSMEDSPTEVDEPSTLVISHLQPDNIVDSNEVSEHKYKSLIPSKEQAQKALLEDLKGYMYGWGFAYSLEDTANVWGYPIPYDAKNVHMVLYFATIAPSLCAAIYRMIHPKTEVTNSGQQFLMFFLMQDAFRIFEGEEFYPFIKTPLNLLMLTYIYWMNKDVLTNLFSGPRLRRWVKKFKISHTM